MRQRIRAAALLVRDDAVLLVEHGDPGKEASWWVPPGGGVEGFETLDDCVRREVFEESGLTIEVGPLAYVRQFAETERGVHHLELFFAAVSWTGELTLENVAGKGDEDMIRSVEWIPRARLSEVTVYPRELGGRFWDDLAAGFERTHYLGMQWSTVFPHG